MMLSIAYSFFINQMSNYLQITQLRPPKLRITPNLSLILVIALEPLMGLMQRCISLQNYSHVTKIGKEHSYKIYQLFVTLRCDLYIYQQARKVQPTMQEFYKMHKVHRALKQFLGSTGQVYHTLKMAQRLKLY